MSKWLEDDHLVRGGKATNWKRQYKLRYNWSKGSARVSETEVAEHPSMPPLLVRFLGEIIVVADSAHGLRAWSSKGWDRLLATAPLSSTNQETRPSPSSLAIDTSCSNSTRLIVSVGFTDGSFAIYTLSRSERTFTRRYTHAASCDGTISAIAFAWPYLLTATLKPILSLYHFDTVSKEYTSNANLKPPRLLCSLKSHTAYPPLSLAIRASSTSSVVASIAYAMPTWSSRWSVGLQELRLTPEGTITESRLASAKTKDFRLSLSYKSQQAPLIPTATSKPTSLSYHHPYLLTAHPDNTLTLYLVTSTTKELTIGSGSQLWGHTSSVSSTYVGERGKAVSVSTVGNELRVWELEGRGPPNLHRKGAVDEASVQVRPEMHENLLDMPVGRGPLCGSHTTSELDESTVAKDWVAFDEEKVVLLREKMEGAQALVVYDFT